MCENWIECSRWPWILNFIIEKESLYASHFNSYHPRIHQMNVPSAELHELRDLLLYIVFLLQKKSAKVNSLNDWHRYFVPSSVSPCPWMSVWRGEGSPSSSSCCWQSLWRCPSGCRARPRGSRWSLLSRARCLSAAIWWAKIAPFHEWTKKKDEFCVQMINVIVVKWKLNVKVNVKLNKIIETEIHCTEIKRTQSVWFLKIFILCTHLFKLRLRHYLKNFNIRAQNLIRPREVMIS